MIVPCLQARGARLLEAGPKDVMPASKCGVSVPKFSCCTGRSSEGWQGGTLLPGCGVHEARERSTVRTPLSLCQRKAASVVGVVANR